MMRYKKCNQVSVRVITKRDLHSLSNSLGPIAAVAGTLATAATVKGASGAASLTLRAAKAASKGPQALLITAAIAAATAAAGVGVKYLFNRRAAGDRTYAYCTSCGHYEAMN